MNTYAALPFPVSGQLVCEASTYPHKSLEAPFFYSSPMPGVPLKYRITRTTLSQCFTPGLALNLLSSLTAWLVSGRVHTARYMSFPMTCLYGYNYICALPSSSSGLSTTDSFTPGSRGVLAALQPTMSN